MLDIIDDIKELFYKKKTIIISLVIIIVLGLLFGSIYVTILSDNDKISLLNNTENYFNSFREITTSNKINIFKDLLIKNIFYFTLLWAFGISIVGVPFTYLMIFYKSFMLGFSISSIFAKYKIDGLFKIFIYIFPSKLLILILSVIIGVFGIDLSIRILTHYFKKKSLNFSVYSGKYFLLFLFAILISIVTSLLEAFLSPILFNLI